jgi:hypothetical protein
VSNVKRGGFAMALLFSDNGAILVADKILSLSNMAVS